jgi:hypothetical protein
VPWLLVLSLGTSLASASLGDQLLTLSPMDGNEGDWFGVSVDATGTMAIVGADHKDEVGNNSGVVYLMEITTGDTLRKLTPTDAAADDQFGFEVAISGSTALVGAPLKDDLALDAGAAYVFDVDTGSQRMKLLPDEAFEEGGFGWSVAVDGDLAVVGAPFVADIGVAYLFDLTTGDQLFRLEPEEGAEGDVFGVSVDISGSTAIVGASGDDQTQDNAGAAYLFDATTGEQLGKLTAADGNTLDFFGFSVAISGPSVVVGSLGASSDIDFRTGAAYVFDAATGAEVWKLVAEDGQLDDSFGISVAIDGNRVVAGAPGDDDLGLEAGAAYVFDLATGRQLAKLLSADGEYEDETGASVAVSGGRAVIGSPFGVAGGVVSGTAPVFDVAGSPTLLQAGDADQDLDFDQLDLVRVQIAAKYLTGQPATWGEGDWDGAPGGGPGDPPQGDGVFNQLDIVAAQIAGLYLTGPYGAAGADRVLVPEPSSGGLAYVAMLVVLAPPVRCGRRGAVDRGGPLIARR